VAVAIRQIKWAATAVGLEQPARAALTTWRRRRSRVYDRTWKDFEHLRLLLAFSLPADANCIDVGAANGKVLAEITRLAPRGRHIAYEPLCRMSTVRQRSSTCETGRGSVDSDAAIIP
jgi:hypothetical protein